jgi:DNA helicase-2/ATP-dependent DNA helicase PcrA
MYGKNMYNPESQFLTEIDEDLIIKKGFVPKKPIFEKPLERKSKEFHEYNYTYDEVDKMIRAGDKIQHKTFGKGVVVEVVEEKVKIAFPYPIGIKVLMKNHPSYEVIN